MSAFGDYYKIQKGIFQSKLSEIIKSTKIEISSDPKKPIISWIVVFKDESILETFEYLEINNNEIKKTKYGYEYKRNSGYFFFYEMDKEKSSLADKLKKPQYHLHIGVKKEYSSHIQKFPELLDHNGPHYKVSPITIDEIIGMIIVNFYDTKIDLLDRLKINITPKAV